MYKNDDIGFEEYRLQKAYWENFGRKFLASSIGMLMVNCGYLQTQNKFYRPLKSRLFVAGVLVIMLTFYLYHTLRDTLQDISQGEEEMKKRDNKKEPGIKKASKK